MEELIQQYWSRALKIARQYETGDVNFADLTGLGEEFAASFSEQLNDCPEAQRTAHCSALENKLVTGIAAHGANNPLAEALDELLLSINRTPIS